MFDNVGSLRLRPDHHHQTLIVSAMISCENEIMEFRTNQLAEGKVEDWMCLVLAEMRRTNRYITKKAIYDYGKVRRPRLAFSNI